MGHIVQPEKLGLVVCPNLDAHKDDGLLVVTDDQNQKMKMYVIRLVFLTEGHVHYYRYPPIEFTVAMATYFHKAYPNMPFAVGNEKCASCLGFENPHLYRRQYREKPPEFPFE